MKAIKSIVNNYGVLFIVKLRKQDGEFGSIVEFYDARFKEGFTEFGQFVSSYYIDSLLEHEGGLILESGINEWFLSEENVEDVKKWLLNR